MQPVTEYVTPALAMDITDSVNPHVSLTAVEASNPQVMEALPTLDARIEDQSISEPVLLVAAAAPVDEFIAPEPAVNYATPVPKVEHVTPAFTVTVTDLSTSFKIQGWRLGLRCHPSSPL